MTRIKATEYTNTYSRVARSASEAMDSNCCAPVAVSIVADKPYEEIQAMFEEEGRKKGKATYVEVTKRVLARLGIELKMVNLESVIRGYPKPHCDVLKNVTTHHGRRFPGTFDPSKRYLAWTAGHVLAIVAGEVHDWSINRSLRIHKLDEVVIK